MNYYSTFLVTLLLFSVQGRNIRKPFRSNKSDEQKSLKQLLQYFRAQKANVYHGISAEDPNSNEAELGRKFSVYRIELSGSKARDDMVPVAEEIPIGSLESNRPSIISYVKVVKKEEAIPPEDIQETAELVPNLEAENPDAENPEEAEDETTTMFPIETIKEAMENSTETIKFSDEDGTSEEYEDEYENEDSEECTEGETKRMPCNNACVCVDGAFFCSKRKCDKTEARNTTAGNDAVPDDENETTILGIKKESPTPLPSCSSGMTKSIDCNQCVCVMGKWACTKGACIALTLREKASYTDGVTVYNQVETLVENKDFDEDCVEGWTKQLDCNQCICHLNSWSCSTFSCGPTPPPKKRPQVQEACQKEGDVKSRECNLCKCVHGIWVCTDHNCKVFQDGARILPAFPNSSNDTRDD